MFRIINSGRIHVFVYFKIYFLFEIEFSFTDQLPKDVPSVGSCARTEARSSVRIPLVGAANWLLEPSPVASWGCFSRKLESSSQSWMLDQGTGIDV